MKLNYSVKEWKKKGCPGASIRSASGSNLPPSRTNLTNLGSQV